MKKLAFFLLFYWSCAIAQSNVRPINIPTDGTTILQQYLEVLVEKDQYLSIPTIIEKQQKGDFSPLSEIETTSNLTNQPPAYWLHFTITNKSTDTLNYWLNTSVFDSLTLVTVHHNKSTIEQKGLLIRYKEWQKERFRALKDNKYGFLLAIPPKQNTYYLRIKNTVRLENSFSNIRLQTISDYEQSHQQLIYFLLFNAAFLSVLFFLALFSLCQYFQNKDKAFLIYTIYLWLVSIYFWWKFEKANSFINLFFTEFPAFYYHLEIPLSITSYITYLIFLLYFINAKREMPVFYRLARYAIGVLFIYALLDRCILYFFDFSFSWEIYFVVRFSFISLGLAVWYSIIKSKSQFAFYLLAGSFAVLVGGFYTIFLSKTMTQHYQGAWDIPLLPVQIGILIEAFLFSVGLGVKSKLMEREKTIIAKNLEQEQLKTKLQAKNEQQLKRWFTNLAHEFRTPLTVIQGIASQVREESRLTLHQPMNMIERNATSLLHLVNQLLDISRLEFKQIKVQAIQGNILPYLSYLTESFHSLAHSKKISLDFYSPIEHVIMDYDPDKIKKIITNLIGNAVKFTPEYGEIIVATTIISAQKITSTTRENRFIIGQVAAKSSEYLKIQVKDSGRGMAAHQLPYIFDRFFQTDNSDKRTTAGTGIGLALTKELIVLLQGIIIVESSLHKGSTFTIYLPISNKASIAENSQTLLEPISKSIKTHPIETRIQQNTSTPELSNKPLLLLVEDNQDVIYYLKSCIAPSYQILEAPNGRIGLEKALTHIPDIIISDIMMPEMDGYELCATLKNDLRTSHIPIILLTAKATQESKQQGLVAGAQAYLTKPFDKQELLTRLDNLVLWQKQMQQYVQQFKYNRPDKTTPALSTSALEIAFLEKLQTVLHQHLDDSNFKAAQLARAMAMSETQLYRKLKALTKQSIGQYIRTIRLAQGRLLVQTTTLLIGEISDKVGFKTQAHFSRVFQEAFGVSPSGMRK